MAARHASRAPSFESHTVSECLIDFFTGEDEGHHSRLAEAVRTTRYFLADAAKPGRNFNRLPEPYDSLNPTLVFNNVGGTPVKNTR
jgi:hypothetical protein